MALALSIFGIAFAACCVWLTVRIVNRRERWAKWTLAAMLGVPLLYVLSNGPAAALYANPKAPQVFKTTADWLYVPIGWVCVKSPPVLKARQWYVNLWLH